MQCTKSRFYTSLRPATAHNTTTPSWPHRGEWNLDILPSKKMMTKQAHEILPGILRATVLIFREELCIFFLEHYGFGHATVFWHKIWVTLVSIQPFQKHLSIDFFVISSCCPNGTCTFGILKGPGTNPFAVTNVDPNFLSG